MKHKAVTIYPFIYRDLKLKGAEAVLYAVIYSYGERGYKGTLEPLLAISNEQKPAVIALLRRLVEKGLITKTKIEGVRSSHYKAVLPEGITYKQAERQDYIDRAKRETLQAVLRAITDYYHEACYDFACLAQSGALGKDLYQKQGEIRATETICREIGNEIAKKIMEEEE